MFSSPKYQPSGLTKEECKIMADYLNKTHLPLSTQEVYWQSSTVCAHDNWRLKMKSQTPIVRLLNRHLSLDDEGGRIGSQLHEYFKKNFEGNYYYHEDQGAYYIINRDTLLKLREEALKSQQSQGMRKI